MSILKNKTLTKIIAMICIFLTLINFGLTNKVYAENELWGGILITPVTMLLTSIADGIISLLQEAIQSQKVSLIEISGSPDWWEDHAEDAIIWFARALVSIIAVAAIIYTAGAAAGVIAGVKAVLKVCVVVGGVELVSVTFTGETFGTVAGSFIAERLGASWFSKTLYMPVFTLTPEEIFANKIQLFDVNFFNPMPATEIEDAVTETQQITLENKEICNQTSDSVTEKWMHLYAESSMFMQPTTTDIFYSDIDYYEGYMFIFDKINSGKETKIDFSMKEKYSVNASITGFAGDGAQEINILITTFDDGGEKLLYTINSNYNFATDESEFETSIDIQEHAATITTLVNSTSTRYIESTAAKLQSVVSTWYFILRNLAILVLMVILIYIGIRIVLGSTAGEKAKYKERMMDWLVAVCLIFIMHYIMAFAHTFVGYITQLIENVGDIDGVLEYVPLTEEQLKNAKQIEGSNETEQVDSPFKETFSQNGTIIEGATNEKGEPQAYLGWTTNLMGKIKIRTQTVNEGTANWVGYSICYIVLVLETLFFSWTYLKRVVYMAFLTVIAPLVAMTYPIDKISDGKAQAFEMWLKEYIFNLLIQPLHLLLYTVLVTMAYQLAVSNPFYAVVAIGFMMPAEKLLRRFFGFTKAQTPGMLSGAAGAALGFTGMQKLMRFGNKGKGREKDEKEESAKIKFSNKDRTNPREAVAKNAMNKNGGVGSQAKTSGDNAGKKAGGTQTKAGGQTQAGATTKLRTKDTSAAKAATADATKGSKDKKEGRKMPKALSVAGRGFKTGFAAIKGYNRRLGIKNAKRMKNGRPIRALARGVAGVYGAAAFGMAGMALGVASGDPSKAFQYGTAGIAGGYSAGKGIAGSAVDAMTVDGSKVQDEMDMAWYGEEYKQKQLEREKESFAKNEKNIDYLRKTMNVSRSRAQEILRETGGQCLDSGVTDIADVAAIQKMSEAGVDIDQAIAAQRFNQYLPSDLDKMGEKERNDHLARWEKEYMQDGYENPRALAERSMELAEQFNKAKSSLKKA